MAICKQCNKEWQSGRGRPPTKCPECREPKPAPAAAPEPTPVPAPESISLSFRVEPQPIPTELDDTAVVAGKTLAQWDEYCESCIDAERAKLTSREQLAVVDFVRDYPIPPEVFKPLDAWKAKGRPRKTDILRAKHKDLMDKGNEYLNFALLDEKEAAELTDPEIMKVIPDRAKVRQMNDAERLLKQARKKREKSAEFFEEARKLLEAK